MSLKDDSARLSDELGEKLTAVKKFTVYFPGWEMDSKAWVVKDASNKLRLVMTSHGMAYFANPKDLQKRLKEYQATAKDTQDALDMLK